MTKVIILNRLLDKYESSKHLMEPGVSNRRVMLRIASGKKEFPEYDYQDASIRDTFNDAATALEKEGFVTNEWVKGRPVLSCVSLNLDKVKECYSLVGRTHLKLHQRFLNSFRMSLRSGLFLGGTIYVPKHREILECHRIAKMTFSLFWIYLRHLKYMTPCMGNRLPCGRSAASAIMTPNILRDV